MEIGSQVHHYRILERLGRGGMGEVFLADDTRLRRPVALKTLTNAARARPGSCARLVEEARVASALNHPGIAVVYDVSEATLGGEVCPFIAMEYVPGCSLAQRLERGALPPEEVLDIALQLADALREAHARGVVHRDVKPGNVMLSDGGRVKVLDFGLATPLPVVDVEAETLSAGHDAPLSSRGLRGTVAYMSPEQARGRSVDARSDVFSLGVVLYEMLAGRPPFDAETTVDVLDAILREPAPPIVALEPGLGRRLEQVVGRMLAKARDERFASMAEVGEALAALRTGRPPAAAAPPPPSVAVLDFSNVTGRSEDAWLGIGIAETLTAELKRSTGVAVVSRERIHEVRRNLAGDGDDDETLVPRLAREVGARFVVFGAHQRLGELVRVTARVTDPGSGRVLHTAKLDGRLDAIFDLQDRVVAEVAAGLRLEAPDQATQGEDTRNVEAYEAWSRGVINLRAENLPALDRAVVFFERALGLDPGYVSAHIGLGTVWSLKGDYLGTPETTRRAVACFRRALELRPGSLDAWRELASAHLALGEMDAAEAAARRALEIDADAAAVHGTLGRILFIGRADFEQAAACYEAALQRNPQGGWYALQLAHCATLLRDFTRAEVAARRALALQEEFLSGRQGLVVVGGYVRLAHLAAWQGRHARALESLDREAAFVQRVDHALRDRILIEIAYRRGASLQRLERAAAARASLEAALAAHGERLRLGSADPHSRYYAACCWALLGERDRALEELEEAGRRRPAFTGRRAASDPDLESLRDDPRFVALTRGWASEQRP